MNGSASEPSMADEGTGRDEAATNGISSSAPTESDESPHPEATRDESTEGTTSPEMVTTATEGTASPEMAATETDGIASPKMAATATEGTPPPETEATVSGNAAPCPAPGTRIDASENLSNENTIQKRSNCKKYFSTKPNGSGNCITY